MTGKGARKTWLPLALVLALLAPALAGDGVPAKGKHWNCGIGSRDERCRLMMHPGGCPTATGCSATTRGRSGSA